METGVTGQRQLNGSPAQGAADGLLVRVADDEAEEGAGRLLRVGVGPVGAHEVPPHLAGRGLGERVGQLRLYERGLGLDVETGQDEDDLVAEAAEPVAADLEGRGRGLAAYALDADAVGAVLGEPYGVEAGGDVGARVPGARRLVQELGGDRTDVDEAAGAGVLGDDAGAVRVDLREREPGAADVRVAEEGVVPAGGLRPALQHVPGDDGARQPVVLPRLPAEVGGGGPGDQGRVGHPPGDHDVGALAQTRGDAEAAEVGVGGEAARVRGGEVVALHVGDAGGDAEASGQVPDGVGESGGVEAARVGDDPHARSWARPRQPSSWRRKVRA